MAANPDWQLTLGLPDRMMYMLDHQLMCDVTLIVGPDQIPIKAHKFMLCSASPVFYCMLDGQMAEKDDIHIPDVERTAFLELLRFIYSDTFNLTEDNVKNVLYAAEKYMLPKVKKACEKRLKALVEEENALFMLDTSHVFNLPELRKTVTKLISENTIACLRYETTEEVSKDCLKTVLELNKTDAPEHIFYEYALRWAENACKRQDLCVHDENIRKVLADTLFLIRFPFMDSEYFSKNISTRSILSKEEVISVFQTFHNSNTCIFTLQKRLPVYIRIMRCVPDFNESRGWMHLEDGVADAIDVSFDKDVILRGLIMFGSKFSDDKYTIDLLIRRGSKSVFFKKDMELTTLKRNPLNELWIENGETLVRNNVYSIRIKMKGPPAFRGKNYLPTVTQDGVTANFIQAPEPNNCTSPTMGQIPGLIVKVP